MMFLLLLLLSYTQQQQPFHPHLPHKSNPSVTAQNRILQLRKNTQINNSIRQLPGCCFFFSFIFPIVWVGLQISKWPTELQSKYRNVYYINYSVVVYQTQFAQLIPPQTVLKTQIARRVQEDLYRNCRLPNPLYTMTTSISTAEQRMTHSFTHSFLRQLLLLLHSDAICFLASTSAGFLLLSDGFIEHDKNA